MRRKRIARLSTDPKYRFHVLIAGVGIFAASLALALAWTNAGVSSAFAAAPDKKSAPDQVSKNWKGRLPISELTEEEAILHALGRLGYGARPGDVERVKKMGLDKWVEQQLHPETIDDSAMQARLDRYPTLTLSATDLMNQYPPPEIAAKRMGVSVEEYRKRMEEMTKAPQGSRPPEDRSPQRGINELAMAKMLRAIYSERQLSEQLDDFWFNHFNVWAQKDLDRYYIVQYEREAIRPHVLGKFRDLLESTSHSPAMLFYLDNWQSVDPRAFEKRPTPGRLGARPSPQQQGLGPKRGLNENYGRELLELHTLGVDGGYTQHDVIDAARCFTGWTIRTPRDKPEFLFDDRLHDPDVKKIMGKKIHAGGIKDGEKLLDLLDKHPSTARFISTKLARRFVTDNPPPELIKRMSKTFQKTDGDIRAVLQTMIYSPEFWSKQAYHSKVKTPFELVASTARALRADVDQPTRLVQWTAQIGEPLYQCQPPTGYKDTAEAWVNTGALLNRLNFAMRLAHNQIPGIRVELGSLIGDDIGTDAKLAFDRTVQEFLGGQVSDQSRTILEKKLDDPQILHARLDDPVKEIDLGILTGLVLGSPEFQRR
jgi:uncharacterized protein (DUF1800 family)